MTVEIEGNLRNHMEVKMQHFQRDWMWDTKERQDSRMMPSEVRR